MCNVKGVVLNDEPKENFHKQKTSTNAGSWTGIFNHCIMVWDVTHVGFWGADANDAGFTLKLHIELIVFYLELVCNETLLGQVAAP